MIKKRETYVLEGGGGGANSWFTLVLRISPRTDSENLDFAAPLQEHWLYGIFCFFGPPAFILKTLSLSKSVQKTLWEPFPAVSLNALMEMKTLSFVHL